jgi:hypothetical protein
MREALWLRLFLTALNFPIPMPFPLLVDNQSAKQVAKSECITTRSKHIDVRYHFVRDHVQSGLFRIVWCPTTSMTTDIFTKSLSFPLFSNHRSMLGLAPRPPSVLL